MSVRFCVHSRCILHTGYNSHEIKWEKYVFPVIMVKCMETGYIDVIDRVLHAKPHSLGTTLDAKNINADPSTNGIFN